jgi:hypothetical protein
MYQRIVCAFPIGKRLDVKREACHVLILKPVYSNCEMKY